MASNGLGFLALENRYVIEGFLKFEGGVHVGSGYEGSETDAEFVRGAFEHKKPFIPGSSLRGVMRSTLERILKAAKPASTCVLFAPESHSTCLTANRGYLALYKDEWEGQKLSAAQQEKALLELLAGDGQCDVCKLFGSELMKSKLSIDDCKSTTHTHAAIRHGVGIDRDTETAAFQIKYDFETLDGAPRFHLRMQIENAGPRDWALLGILLHEMQHQGIHVGGKKSRGLGLCRLEKNYSVSYFDRENLMKFLTTGKPDPFPEFEAKVLGPAITAYLQGGANAAATA
jgi:CRISPR-associated protein Csm3